MGKTGATTPPWPTTGDTEETQKEREEVRAVEAELTKLPPVLSSPGALTLISKVTDRANESMEQGVSPAFGFFPGWRLQDLLHPAHLSPGALQRALGSGLTLVQPQVLCVPFLGNWFPI